MAKKITSRLIALMIIFLYSSLAYGQFRPELYSNDDKVGLGLQTTYPFSGISIKYKIIETFSVQAVLGILFETKQSSIRALYHFYSKDASTTYCFGQVGQYSVRGYRLTDEFRLEKTTEKILGYGIGLGIEYFLRQIAADVPLWVNIELVYGDLEFEEVDFDYRAITVGGGLHYYF